MVTGPIQRETDYVWQNAGTPGTDATWPMGGVFRVVDDERRGPARDGAYVPQTWYLLRFPWDRPELFGGRVWVPEQDLRLNGSIP